MTRDEALELLPESYSLALRLRDAGASAALMAERLDVHPAAVDALVSLAELKLATALKRGGLQAIAS
jgi:DNA-directed RNA polymerase specialized sigma24 family protein